MRSIERQPTISPTSCLGQEIWERITEARPRPEVGEGWGCCLSYTSTDERGSIHSILSLRSWRYCRRARNKVLVAEPQEASGEAARNISKSPSPFSSRLRRSLLVLYSAAKNFSRAPTIPPATQATPSRLGDPGEDFTVEIGTRQRKSCQYH